MPNEKPSVPCRKLLPRSSISPHQGLLIDDVRLVYAPPASIGVLEALETTGNGHDMLEICLVRAQQPLTTHPLHTI